MQRVAAPLIFTTVLLAATAVFAGTESHNQYRSQGPTRYVVSVFEVVHDHGVVKTHKRTFKWKQTVASMASSGAAPNERGILPGEWYGPIVVDKSVDHISWAGGYWRNDGAFESNVYEVEVEELRPVGRIAGNTYSVEVRVRLMKRPPLFQPNLDEN